MTEQLREEIIEIVQSELSDLGISICQHCKVSPSEICNEAAKSVLERLLALDTGDWCKDEFRREYRYLAKAE